MKQEMLIHAQQKTYAEWEAKFPSPLQQPKIPNDSKVSRILLQFGGENRQSKIQ